MSVAPGSVTRAGPVLATAGAVLVVVASFLVWLQTGAVGRSSYAVVRSAELLGVVQGAPAMVLKIWYLVPALAAGVWLAAITDHRRLVVALGALLAAIAFGVSAAVLHAPVRTGPGPLVALAGVAVLVAGLALTLFDRRGAR